MNEIALAYYAQHTMTHGTAMQIAATEAVAEIERLRAELAMHARGECICVRCGLRQNGQKQEAPF